MINICKLNQQARTTLPALIEIAPMKKDPQKLPLLAVLVSLFIFVSPVMSATPEGDNIVESHITVSEELESLTPAEIEEIKQEVRTALNSISQILGIEYRQTTKIRIVDKGICYANDGIISLSISHIKDKSSPIIHEVTHILANHKYNSFYSEGLAVYFQERFGESYGFPNFSSSLDALVKNYKDQLLPISKLHNDNDIFEMIGTEQRKIAYIEAGSFINFLVEKYGEKKLAALNNSSSLNYKIIYGKEINALEAEWKNHILRK